MSNDEKFQQYFNFNHGELLANTQGRVTENQQAHVKSKVQRFNSRILVTLTVVFVIGFGMNFAVRMASATDGSFSTSLPVSMLGPVIVVILWSYLCQYVPTKRMTLLL